MSTPQMRHRSTPHSTPHSETEVPADAAYWRARLAVLMAEHDVPGAALGILREGQIVDTAAGLLSRTTLVAATPDSVFNIGSITKVWTTTLIMQLVDEGAVALETPVVDVLPEFDVAHVANIGAARAITIRHLLNHTSGLEDLYIDTGRGDDCVERCVATLRELRQVRPVGAMFCYCNSAFVVAGRIVEVVTGKSWDATLRERLIEPLGLTATVTLPEEAIVHRVAVGHPGGAGAPPTSVWSGPRAMGPSGRISARVHDLLVFARMHLAGGVAPDGTRLLSADSIRAMTEQEVAIPYGTLMGSSWGLGWARDHWDGQLVVGHNGIGIGQLAFLRMLPARRFAVALLTNGGDGHSLYHDVFAEVFRELAGVAMPPPLEPPAEPTRVDPAPYVGRYHSRSDCDVEIVSSGDHLVLRTVSTGLFNERYPDMAGEYPLVPVAEDRFAMRENGSRSWESVHFRTLPDGTRCLYTAGGLMGNPLIRAALGD